MKSKITTLILLTILFSGNAWASKKDVLGNSVMGEGIGGMLGDFNIHSKETFLKDSKEVIWFAGFKGFMSAYQANLRAEWITPAGEIFKSEKFTTRYGNCRFGWAKLDVQGADKQALSLEGEWTVRIFWDDDLIDTKKFYIGERKFSQQALPADAQPSELAETADGHMRLAKAYFAKKDTDRAIQELMLAQKLAPNEPDAYLVMGNVLNSIGRPDEAILQFTKAQALKADEAAVHRGLGNAYIKLALLPDAIKEYEILLKIHPDSKEDSLKLDELKKATLSTITTLPNKIVANPSTIGFVKISADKTQIAVGQPVTIKYNLFLKKSATYEGFYREMSVKNFIINVLRPDNTIGGQGRFKERSYFGLTYAWNDKKKKMFISRMGEESPCHGQLAVSDEIESIDGIEITGTDQLLGIIRSRELDKDALFVVMRGDQRIEARIVPMKSFSEWTVLDKDQFIGFGIAGQFIFGKGIRVNRSEDGGVLIEGDLIQQVDGIQMSTANDWRKVVNGAVLNTEYKFTISRSGQPKTVSIVARKERVAATAEFMPQTSEYIKREENIVDKVRYAKASVETIKLSFNFAGKYVLDPGTIKLQSDVDKNTDIIMSGATIEFIVV